MKKSTITILGILMAISFVSLIVLQSYYIDEVLELRKQHLEESVQRSISEVAHQLEVNETMRYLEQGSDAYDGLATAYDSVYINTDSTLIQRTHQVKAKDGSVFSYSETTANTKFSDKYFTKLLPSATAIL